MDFMKAIQAAVRLEIDKITDEEVKAAQARVVERVRHSADRLALRVLAQYDVESRTDRLIITVKKAGDA